MDEYYERKWIPRTKRNSKAVQPNNQMVRLIKRDGPNCHYCGRLIPYTEQSRDHVIPACLGGKYVLENLVLACKTCNSSRNHNLDVCDCDFCGPIYREYRKNAYK